jgi:phosphate transport system protein
MTNEHIVGKFDDELSRIKSEILEMGDLVIEQIHLSTNAMMSLDTEDIDNLIQKDLKINGMYKTINRHAEQIIAMRQPVAIDLRMALLATSIASELERLGDYAKTTAQGVKKLSDDKYVKKLTSLLGDMSKEVQDMLSKILKAYQNNDIKLAAKIRKRDRIIDESFKKILNTVIKSTSKIPEDSETLIYIVLLARNFERAGDRIVNISRQVHQIVTGIDLKASD